MVGERRFFGHKLEPASAAAQELFPGTELFRDALDVDDGFVIDCWNWGSSQGGYATSVTPYGGRIPNPPDSEKWRSLAAYLGHARAGGDVPTTTVGTWAIESDDEDFVEVAADLIVDLTDEDLGALWKPFLEANTNPDDSLTLCLALLHRGLLVDIPLVLSSYQKNADIEIFEDLQYALNELFWFRPECAINGVYWMSGETFTRPPLFKTAEECCKVVQLQMQALVKSLGSVHIPIFRNELFDVCRIAVHIKEISDAKFLTDTLRHLFEASTGIDCKTFFVDTIPQLEAAQTIARNFLASPASTRFEPGRRYFFGYPLRR